MTDPLVTTYTYTTSARDKEMQLLDVLVQLVDSSALSMPGRSRVLGYLTARYLTEDIRDA